MKFKSRDLFSNIERKMAKGKSIDQKYMGPEPVFNGPVSNPMELSRALTWYNYFYTVSDARPWLNDYVKKNFTKEEYALYKRLPDWRVSMTDCTLARISARGAVLPENVAKNMLGRLRLQLQYAAPVEEVKKEDTKPVVSIQDRVKEKANKIVADLETEIDTFINNDYVASKFSAYDFLKSKDAKSAQAKIVMQPYADLLDELQAAIDKTDAQLVEGYSRLKKKQLTAYRDFIKQIISDCERFFGNKNASKVRKPRKKKEKSAAQLIDKLQYKKEDNDLKIVSVDPINIVGAQSIWIYNSKYKKLTVLHAKNGSGLSVKGTTIINFDETTSKTKTLRKPNETIQKVLSGGKVILRNLMSEIKTKESPAVGRTNADTVLLRYVK